MTESLKDTLKQFSHELYKRRPHGSIDTDGQEEELNRFYYRLEEGSTSRDENPYSHFCVYFAAYDSSSQKVFIGHHKKSGLWLFNGGHIDQGESPKEALKREIREEWGGEVDLSESQFPQFLSITDINNPTKQTCTLHYDIWYFVPVREQDFSPDPDLLSKEFHSTRWLTIEEARNFVVDRSTLESLDFIQNELF